MTSLTRAGALFLALAVLGTPSSTFGELQVYASHQGQRLGGVVIKIHTVSGLPVSFDVDGGEIEDKDRPFRADDAELYGKCRAAFRRHKLEANCSQLKISAWKGADLFGILTITHENGKWSPNPADVPLKRRAGCLQPKYYIRITWHPLIAFECCSRCVDACGVVHQECGLVWGWVETGREQVAPEQVPLEWRRYYNDCSALTASPEPASLQPVPGPATQIPVSGQPIIARLDEACVPTFSQMRGGKHALPPRCANNIVGQAVLDHAARRVVGAK